MVEEVNIEDMRHENDSRSPSVRSVGPTRSKSDKIPKVLTPISAKSPEFGRNRSGSLDSEISKTNSSTRSGLSRFTLANLTSSPSLRRDGGLNVMRTHSINGNDSALNEHYANMENEEKEMSDVRTPVQEKKNNSSEKSKLTREQTVDSRRYPSKAGKGVEKNDHDRGVDLLVPKSKRGSRNGE